MPTLRIQFPEKDTPSTIVLDAPKITIGRRADNTIQIVDRMVSAFHAELIREDDHYRLHDRESTNGTRVNGEMVTDFHLREACKINFGLVECEFSPEVTQGVPVETLPTRVEVEAVRRENEVLRGRLDTAQQELASLRQVSEAGTDEAGTNVLRAELERIIRERTELQEAAQNRDREFAALKTELARMNRDRQNLQDALSQANAELANLRTAAQPAEPAPEEKAATPKPAPAGLAGLPKPSAVAAAELTPRPPQPAARPAAPQTPTSPATPSGPRPVARPAVAASGGAPAPTPRVIAQPAAKPGVPARANSGPSGTQKISIPAQSQSPSSAQPHSVPRPRPIAVPSAGTPRTVPGTESSQQ